MRRLLVWLVFSCTCTVFCFASPARRQYVSYTETSSEPSVVVTNDGESWDDSDDDFDLEGDGWLKEVSASPPSALPYSVDYEDYDGEEDSEVPSPNAAEESNNSKQDSEFLFLSPKETRLVLEDDDDDQSGLIKVRHTSKNSFTEPREDSANFIEDGDPNQQFVFTIDDDDEDDNNNKIDTDDKDDDFVLEESDKKPDAKINTVPRREARDDDDDDNDDDDDDDDDNQVDANNGDDSVFDSPEEDAQVIYGDHVFLY